jgi:hypothetical protein
MIETYALAAVVLFVAGAVIGFLVVISLGIHREETALTVTGPAKDRMASGVRLINGMTSRTPGIIQEVSLHRQGL